MNLNEAEKQMRKVRVVLRHGRSKSADPDSELTVFAELYDAVTNESMISADLKYVIKACKDRKYIIVK